MSPEERRRQSTRRSSGRTASAAGKSRSISSRGAVTGKSRSAAAGRPRAAATAASRRGSGTARTTSRAGAARRPTAKPSRARTRRYRRSFRLPVGHSSVRIRAFMMVVALLVVVVVGRAFQLQALDAQAFADEAAKKMQYTRTLAAERGQITDRNGVVLASTEPAMRIVVDPDMVMTNGADKRYAMSERKQEEAALAPQAVSEILAKHLGGRPADYLETVTTEDSRYEVVERKVPAATWVALRDELRAGLDGDGKRPWFGVFAESDPIRNYPNRALAGNVVGFVNHEGVGAAGIEAKYDDDLDGEPGQQVFDSSTFGRIPLGTNVMTPPTNGRTYELTIDADMQWLAEQALADGIRDSGARTGMAVVMDVNDGQLLALANHPAYDPNNPGDVDPGDLGNPAVSAAYEPGSVQKVLTMAALADAGLVTPDTQVVVPPRIASGGGFVGDSFEHGTLQLTARGIIAQSSNVGTIELVRDLPKEQLSDYLASFGLGSAPGSGLPGETTGSLPGPDMADYTRDQISFGQGLSVSAVQMAAAVAAAVNGGTYHQPTLIRSVREADGTEVELPERESRQVISEQASEMTVNMMEAVITQVGKDRAIPGYRTAGKSGTAQRFDPKCKCYNGFTASFVGVAPAEDPQLLVYVVLDQPRNGNLGSQLALPVVNNILQTALPRYNIVPSTTPPLKEPLTF